MASAAETKLVRSLEEGGLSRRAAVELVAALDQSRCLERRSDPWMLAYAVLLLALTAGGFGWMNSRIDTQDAKTTAQFGTLAAKIDETREEMFQRFTAIETIIDERLPSARRR